MPLQLISSIFNFKEMIRLLTFKEINSSKQHIFIHKKYNHLRQLYSFAELYKFQGGLISSSKEIIFIQAIIFIQGKYIYSGKLYSFKERYSLKEILLVQVQGHMFIQENYIHSATLCSRTQQKYLLNNCPQPLYDNYKLHKYHLLNKV